MNKTLFLSMALMVVLAGCGAETTKPTVDEGNTDTQNGVGGFIVEEEDAETTGDVDTNTPQDNLNVDGQTGSVETTTPGGTLNVDGATGDTTIESGDTSVETSDGDTSIKAGDTGVDTAGGNVNIESGDTTVDTDAMGGASVDANLE